MTSYELVKNGTPTNDVRQFDVRPTDPAGKPGWLWLEVVKFNDVPFNAMTHTKTLDKTVAGPTIGWEYTITAIPPGIIIAARETNLRRRLEDDLDFRALIEWVADEVGVQPQAAFGMIVAKRHTL